MNKKQKKQLRRQRRLKKRAADRNLRCGDDSRLIEFDCVPVAIQAADVGAEGEEKRTPTFNMLAYSGGLMRVARFEHPVVVELSGIDFSSQPVSILRSHNESQGVGHPTQIEVTAEGLRVGGTISFDNQHTQEILSASKNNFQWQASIGATPLQYRRVRKGETIRANGRTFEGPLIHVLKARLREVSFVTIGADHNTSVQVAAEHHSRDIDMNFDQWLTAKGFDSADLSEDQLTSLQAMYDAEQEAESTSAVEAGGGTATATEVADITATMRADAAAEIERQDRITEICANYDNPSMEINGKSESIRAMAIREGWTTERTELEALRESRPKAAAVHAHSHAGRCTIEAMQGAMMLRAGLRLDDDAWQSSEALWMDVPEWLRAGINDEQKQRAMEHAHRYSDMSLFDLCAEAVRMDGGVIPSGRLNLIKAAFSGSTLTNIFTSNVNTQVLSTYMETGDTTQPWTSTTDVADFKTNERPRMTKGPDLEKLPPGGTADHVSRSDIGESYKIARYAKQFVIDEQDVINDRFNALMDMPREMGLAAARLRPDLVYAILLANAALADGTALFHADHGNLDTTSALADATLRAAITAIAVQQENGVNLNLRASHLIVPSDLKFTASQLINSSEVRGATGQTGTRNPLQDENLTMISDSRLSNGVTDPATGTAHAGSVSTWFLVAAMAHTIEVAYLRGTGRAPRVRRFNLEKGQYGIGWDVNMDIGAKSLDYRGLHKSTA